MWNGKKKALTFSFDDGAKQDIRAIEILDKYKLKATFNLNSGWLGKVCSCEYKGRTIDRSIVSANKVKDIYKNHEVASHTLAHPLLTAMEDDDIVYQVETDRRLLAELCGYEVCGMAYPGGGINNDDRVANVIKSRTSVKYARTITSTHSFDLQCNLHRFDPTVYHLEADKMFALAHEFIELKTDTPKLFYIWGHTYEYDFSDEITWSKFEEFCSLFSGCDDIFFGTNSQVLLP